MGASDLAAKVLALLGERAYLSWDDDGFFYLVGEDHECLCESRYPSEILACAASWREILDHEAANPAAAGISQASLTNSPRRRGRKPDPKVAARRKAILAIVQSMWPMTVRQVFYAATVRGLVPKTENGYAAVDRDLVLLRRTGELPYGHIADSTRWQRKPRTFHNVDHA